MTRIQPPGPQYGGRIRNGWQASHNPLLGYLFTSPGQATGLFSAAVVWSGAASFTASFILNAAAGALVGGAYAFPFSWGLDTRRPAARFRNPIVLHSFEALLHWPVPLVGKDSGIYWGVAGNKVVGGAEGVGVYNDNGVLTFVSRGPAGVETMPLGDAVNPAAEWNKVRVDMFHASYTSDAGFRVYLNDVMALERRYVAGHKLPVPVAGAYYTAYLGQDDAAVPMYVRNYHYFDAGSEYEASPSRG